MIASLSFKSFVQLLNGSNAHEQIDELVVQAVELKMNPKEIESFAHVLRDMQTSLKVDLTDSLIICNMSYLYHVFF